VPNVTPAFWDASAVVPLCIPEDRDTLASPAASRLASIPLMCLVGQTRISEKQHRQTLTTLERLPESWREILPSDR
jgi:hypothetical protein